MFVVVCRGLVMKDFAHTLYGNFTEIWKIVRFLPYERSNNALNLKHTLQNSVIHISRSHYDEIVKFRDFLNNFNHTTQSFSKLFSYITDQSLHLKYN